MRSKGTTTDPFGAGSVGVQNRHDNIEKSNITITMVLLHLMVILYTIYMQESIIVHFFFFQAEDGIRDLYVTEFRRVLFRSVTNGALQAGQSVLIQGASSGVGLMAM